MQPYEAEAVIASLVKSWIRIRVDRLGELVDRILQQEAWNPRANKEGFAPSAVEVLRFIDDTLEAFFRLPIPMHAVLLPKLVSGLDKSIEQYILKAKSGCGNRNTFIPTLPPLTRCSTKAKFGVFRTKEKSQMTQMRRALVGTTNGGSSFDVPQLCGVGDLQIWHHKIFQILAKKPMIGSLDFCCKMWRNPKSLKQNHVGNKSDCCVQNTLTPCPPTKSNHRPLPRSLRKEDGEKKEKRVGEGDRQEKREEKGEEKKGIDLIPEIIDLVMELH